MCGEDGRLFRRETYRHMEQKMRVLTAEKVYRELEHMNLTEIELQKLQKEFTVDDHCFWENSKIRSEKQKFKIAGKM